MIRLRDVMVSATVLAALGSVTVEASQRSTAAVCKPASGLLSLADLPEASGIAASRTSTGRLWVHNDSGQPVLIAVDGTGKPAGRLTLAGARVEDWEALASGPCASGACLYVGDIGDNDATRKQITIYRVIEPSQPNGSAKAEAFHASYPDGSHDAETLLAAPDGTLLIVTKGDTGPVALYKFPRQLQAGRSMKLQRVGSPLAAQPRDDGRVTDGAFSADGRWVVLRTRTALVFYRGDDFMRGNFQEAHRMDLSSLKEPQGEAVGFGTGNTVYVAGEGGGKNQPGTLATLSCEP